MKTNLSFLKETLIAHRGFHDQQLYIIENSLSSIKRAIEHGYSIELDLQMLKDETIVVYHDDNLMRLCGIDLKLKDLTYEQLQQYTYLNTTEKIPTLQEVLKVVNGQVALLIELKRTKKMTKMIELFNEIMSDYHGIYAVFSFSPALLKWYYHHNPSVTYGIIASYFKDQKFPRLVKWYLKSLRVVKKYRADFISYHIKDLPNKYLDKYKADKVIISYTANSQEELDFVRSHYDNVVFQNFIPKK